MNIRIEDTDGKRTYYVNDVRYDRLQDIPVEYRSYFADADQNGIPDQFDSLINLAKGKAGFSEVADTIASGENNTRQEERTGTRAAPSSTERIYRRDDGRTNDSFPLYIKILFFLAIAFLLGWFIVSRLPATPDTSQNDSTGQGAADGTVAQEVPEATLTEEVNPETFRFVVEDPNEPPYKMFVNVFHSQTLLFAFDLPPGTMIETGSERLAVGLEVPQGTRLTAAVFDATIPGNRCPPDKIAWMSRYIGETLYQTAIVSESAAGHTYDTYYYLLKGDYCAQFSLTLRSVKSSDLREFNPDYLVGLVEDVLRTTRFE